MLKALTFQIPQTMKTVLNSVYGSPASVTIITQVRGWKYGKTDFALLLTEMCFTLGLIQIAASNTETKDGIDFINDFQNLDYWLTSSKRRKMFLFDEAIEAAQRRRAMSNINVEWIRRIPQLSKSRCHLLVITQETELTESAFFKWSFLRGVWTKLNRTTVTFMSRYVANGKVLKWIDLPPTTIKFDPYLLATFTEKPISVKGFKDSDYKQLYDHYFNGKNWKDLGMRDHMVLARLKDKILKFHLEQKLTAIIHSSEG